MFLVLVTIYITPCIQVIRFYFFGYSNNNTVLILLRFISWKPIHWKTHWRSHDHFAFQYASPFPYYVVSRLVSKHLYLHLNDASYSEIIKVWITKISTSDATALLQHSTDEIDFAVVNWKVFGRYPILFRFRN